MDESKENGDQIGEISASEKPYRNIEHKATNIPGMQAYMYTEMAESGNSTTKNEMMNVKDLKLAIHTYSIQNLIIAKCFALIVFSIGIHNQQFISTIPLSLLDIIGYYGSSRLSSILNLIFIIYLVLSIIIRLFLSFYSYSFLNLTSTCFNHQISYAFQPCNTYLMFTLGSILLVIFELFQISLSIKFISELKQISQKKKEEMHHIIRSKLVPRFICCGKLKNWTLAFE